MIMVVAGSLLVGTISMRSCAHDDAGSHGRLSSGDSFIRLPASQKREHPELNLRAYPPLNPLPQWEGKQ